MSSSPSSSRESIASGTRSLEASGGTPRTLLRVEGWLLSGAEGKKDTLVSRTDLVSVVRLDCVGKTVLRTAAVVKWLEQASGCEKP